MGKSGCCCPVVLETRGQRGLRRWRRTGWKDGWTFRGRFAGFDSACDAGCDDCGVDLLDMELVGVDGENAQETVVD